MKNTGARSGKALLLTLMVIVGVMLSATIGAAVALPEQPGCKKSDCSIGDGICFCEATGFCAATCTADGCFIFNCVCVTNLAGRTPCTTHTNCWPAGNATLSCKCG